MPLNEETLKELERQGLEQSSEIEETEDIVIKGDEIEETVVEETIETEVEETEADKNLREARKEAKTATDALAAFKADNDIASKEAKAAKMNDYIFDQVGGEDKFKALGEYLRSRIPATDMDLMNAKLLSGNKGIVQEALATAVKKYNTLRGVHTKMEGDSGIQSEGFVHVTKDQYFTIMKSEKYKTDPIYQNKMDNLRLKSKAIDLQKYGKGQYWGTNPTGGRYAL